MARRITAAERTRLIGRGQRERERIEQRRFEERRRISEEKLETQRKLRAKYKREVAAEEARIAAMKPVYITEKGPTGEKSQLLIGYAATPEERTQVIKEYHEAGKIRELERREIPIPVTISEPVGEKVLGITKLPGAFGREFETVREITEPEVKITRVTARDIGIGIRPPEIYVPEKIARPAGEFFTEKVIEPILEKGRAWSELTTESIRAAAREQPLGRRTIREDILAPFLEAEQIELQRKTEEVVAIKEQQKQFEEYPKTLWELEERRIEKARKVKPWKKLDITEAEWESAQLYKAAERVRLRAKKYVPEFEKVAIGAIPTVAERLVEMPKIERAKELGIMYGTAIPAGIAAAPTAVFGISRVILQPAASAREFKEAFIRAPAKTAGEITGATIGVTAMGVGLKGIYKGFKTWKAERIAKAARFETRIAAERAIVKDPLTGKQMTVTRARYAPTQPFIMKKGLAKPLPIRVEGFGEFKRIYTGPEKGYGFGRAWTRVTKVGELEPRFMLKYIEPKATPLKMVGPEITGKVALEYYKLRPKVRLMKPITREAQVRIISKEAALPIQYQYKSPLMRWLKQPTRVQTEMIIKGAKPRAYISEAALVREKAIPTIIKKKAIYPAYETEAKVFLMGEKWRGLARGMAKPPKIKKPITPRPRPPPFEVVKIKDIIKPPKPVKGVTRYGLPIQDIVPPAPEPAISSKMLQQFKLEGIPMEGLTREAIYGYYATRLTPFEITVGVVPKISREIVKAELKTKPVLRRRELLREEMMFKEEVLQQPRAILKEGVLLKTRLMVKPKTIFRAKVTVPPIPTPQVLAPAMPVAPPVPFIKAPTLIRRKPKVKRKPLKIPKKYQPSLIGMFKGIKEPMKVAKKQLTGLEIRGILEKKKKKKKGEK